MRKFAMLIVVPFLALLTLGLAPTEKEKRETDTNGAAASFEALRKRLPKTAEDWVKEAIDGRYKIRVAVARRTAPADAKVTLLFEAFVHGKLDQGEDLVFTLDLRYFEQSWTVIRTRFSHPYIWSQDPSAGKIHWRTMAHRLELAIDQCGGK